MSAFDDWFRQYKKSDRWNLSTVSQSREDAFNAGLAEVERQKEIVLRQTKLNTKVIAERDQLARCCTQRGARMQLMREWMTQNDHEDSNKSCWVMFLYDRDYDPETWFDADGVPTRALKE